MQQTSEPELRARLLAALEQLAKGGEEHASEPQ
jgi:hypothetical protein